MLGKISFNNFTAWKYFRNQTFHISISLLF